MTEQTLSMPDFRLDHTMIRVKDLDQSLDFYTRILGMKIHRNTEFNHGYRVVEFRQTKANLEDIFMNVTEGKLQ